MSQDEALSPASQSVELHTSSSPVSTHLYIVLHLPHSRQQLHHHRQSPSVSSFSLSPWCWQEYSCWVRSGFFGDTTRSGLQVNVLPASTCSPPIYRGEYASSY